MKSFIIRVLKGLSIKSPKELVNLPKLLSKITDKIFFYYQSTSIREFLWLSIMYLVTKTDYFSEFNWWNENLPTYFGHLPKERKNWLPGHFLEIINELQKDNRNIQVLEVGSGPLSNLLWGIKRNLYHVTAIDPLASIFNKLSKKYKFSYPIKPRKGHGENLIKIFKKESFDVVFSRNVLDHTISPKRCIDNMYFVLKQGGIMYIEGFLQEGTHLNWIGLHQHDLIPENNHLIHYNKMGLRTNLTKGFKLSCICQEKDGNRPGDWYRIIFKKAT